MKLSGIILKMACLIRDSRGTKSRTVSKPSSKLLKIPADELVQVIAKVCTPFLQMGLGFMFT
jgi:hypothetical protein